MNFTQAQLIALLVLRQFLRSDYRGLATLVAEWQDLRKALGLRKVPHYSTLADAARRQLPPWTRPVWERSKSASIPQRAWPKLAAVLHTHSHLIIGAVTGIGLSQASPDFTPVLRQAAAIIALDTVLADAGSIASGGANSASNAASLPSTAVTLGRRWPKTHHRRALRHTFLAPSTTSGGTSRVGSEHKRRLGSALTA
ncbi:hypothetical protein [Pseudoroseomonas ludipueritiae]|uniref:hypothetical protein n=1 Tax=Pseudoroseomonas ludipueritiae TaxID=198093 RepID=UPI001887F4D6|nr:hypothetical protein [Pseudoroseomonas ludipueritiae]